MTPEQVAHIMALVDKHVLCVVNRNPDDPAVGALMDSRAAVEAALRDAPQAEGWVMVPREPTYEMQNACLALVDLTQGDPDDSRYDDGRKTTDSIYRAMLAARPSAPTAVEPPYPMATTIEGAAQDVAKWLNERPNSPLDLRHVAMLVHAVQVAPTAVEPDERAERDAFQAWANREGYDTAYNYDTERSRWVFFNPMTADLWKAWRASKGTPL